MSKPFTAKDLKQEGVIEDTKQETADKKSKR